MQIGSFAVVFFSLSTVTNAVLQGIDRMSKSVTHSAISLAIHAVLVYIMLKHLDWNVYGLVIGNVTFALVVCILNWFSIGRALRYRQEIRTTFALPLLAAAIMGACSRGIFYGIYTLSGHNTISMLVTIPLAIVIYAVLIAVFHVVTEDELPEMPFGRKLLALFRHLRLM